jgi:sulfate transport system permease protein
MIRQRHALPGFRVTLAFTLLYVGLIVVVPLAGLVAKAASLDGSAILTLLSNPRTLAAFRVSFFTAAAASLINLPLGLLLAWTLTRYRFPGRAVLDALIDLPFALPTAVAGVALTTLYVDDGWVGALLARIGVTVAFTPLGIGVALLFVGLPFVVRSLQPVMAALGRESDG